MSGAKRRKLQRLPHTHITPEVAFAFAQIQKLETQCSCAGPQEECPACRAWWAQHNVIHRALRMPPHIYPCLPDPNGPASAAAKALYEELQNVLMALDEQALQVLETLAQPLEPLREPFFRCVFNELSQYTPEQIGPGLVSRVAQPLQREFLSWRRA